MSFTRSKENGELFEPGSEGRGILGFFGRKVQDKSAATVTPDSQEPNVVSSSDPKPEPVANVLPEPLDPQAAVQEAAKHRAKSQEAGLFSEDLFEDDDQVTLVSIDQNKGLDQQAHSALSAEQVDLQAPETWDGEGPYQYGEGPANLPRFDLGALKLPLLPGLQMMPVINEQGDLIAIELIYGASQMQVSLYSASRNPGLWEESLPYFKSVLHSMEFQLFDLPTPYGEGFLGRPVLIDDDQDAQEVMAGLNTGSSIIDEMSEEELEEALSDPFVPLGMDLTRYWQNALSEHPMSTLVWGIEGNRWLLRVIFRGQCAEDEAERADLMRVLRLIEVDRGNEPHTPGEVLTLNLPQEVMEQM